jgi:hypothetical protein
MVMKHYWCIAGFVSVALLLSAAGESGASITLTPVADGYGYAPGSTTVQTYSFDGGTGFQVGTYRNNAAGTTRNIYRSAIKFDLSSIPDESVIESATLSLYGGYGSWMPVPNGASALFPVQLKYSASDIWSSPYGSVTPISNPGAVLDAQTPQNYTGIIEVKWNLLANNNWQYVTDLADNALTLVLTANNEATSLAMLGTNRYGFYSMEWSDPLLRPRLDIVVSDPASVVPEPSALIIWSLLGGLGMAVAHWRRRKAA